MKLADFALAAAEAAVDIAFKEHMQRVERHLNRSKLAEIVIQATVRAWEKLEKEAQRATR